MNFVKKWFSKGLRAVEQVYFDQLKLTYQNDAGATVLSNMPYPRVKHRDRMEREVYFIEDEFSKLPFETGNYILGYCVDVAFEKRYLCDFIVENGYLVSMRWTLPQAYWSKDTSGRYVVSDFVPLIQHPGKAGQNPKELKMLLRTCGIKSSLISHENQSDKVTAAFLRRYPNLDDNGFTEILEVASKFSLENFSFEGIESYFWKDVGDSSYLILGSTYDSKFLLCFDELAERNAFYVFDQDEPEGPIFNGDFVSTLSRIFEIPGIPRTSR